MLISSCDYKTLTLKPTSEIVLKPRFQVHKPCPGENYFLNSPISFEISRTTVRQSQKMEGVTQPAMVLGAGSPYDYLGSFKKLPELGSFLGTRIQLVDIYI